MKNSFRNSLLHLISFLMLMSTVSFTISKHFCGDYLVDTAINLKAKTCGMEKASSEGLVQGDCCSTTKTTVEGQKDFKNIQLNHDSIDQLFITIAYSFLIPHYFTPEKPAPFDDYAPPLIVKDISVLHATFLI